MTKNFNKIPNKHYRKTQVESLKTRFFNKFGQIQQEKKKTNNEADTK